MDSNVFDASSQRRCYGRAHGLDEQTHSEVTDLSSYSQPQYAPREELDSIHSNWAPPIWPNNVLSTTSSLNGPQGLPIPSLNEPQNTFDMTSQLPAPWASLQNAVPNGTPANMTLPFPASDSGYMTRTPPATMAPVPASAPLSSSNGYGRVLIESNDGNDEDNPYSTTIMEPNVTSSETRPLYNVAWASSSRRELKSNSQTSHGIHSVNGNQAGNRMSRRQINRDGAPSNRNDSDSDSNHRSRGRLNHDLTEKRYRKRLNDQFETLLKALPAHLIAESEGSIGGPDDRREKRISKADVLILAKRQIETEERRKKKLEENNRALTARHSLMSGRYWFTLNTQQKYF
ncbi:hypothetical protein N431DRAFT_459482 [Stipitochalara longipes BDJ]|nr:hypothetical protein N431DRAFT_459482 [Stipitochalara longipes BDJ]